MREETLTARYDDLLPILLHNRLGANHLGLDYRLGVHGLDYRLGVDRLHLLHNLPLVIRLSHYHLLTNSVMANDRLTDNRALPHSEPAIGRGHIREQGDRQQGDQENKGLHRITNLSFERLLKLTAAEIVAIPADRGERAEEAVNRPVAD